MTTRRTMTSSSCSQCKAGLVIPLLSIVSFLSSGLWITEPGTQNFSGPILLSGVEASASTATRTSPRTSIHASAFVEFSSRRRRSSFNKNTGRDFGMSSRRFVSPPIQRGTKGSSRKLSRHRKDDWETSPQSSPDGNDDPSNAQRHQWSRRNFVSLVTLLSCMVLPDHQQADARGLVQFPCTQPLLNTYHFMRAGTSILELEQDIWSTNPLFLTNREDALSDPVGRDEVCASVQQLKSLERLPTVIKHSLAAASIDTANIVGQELKLGRDRIVPEYTFLDPRAIGRWDMLSKAETEPAVWAMDTDEAGVDGNGKGSRPPPNEDGTPHETLADQAVRLRQLFSALETQYSGDTILIIFSDGTGPALLSAMIAGIPYNRCHELEFKPGEVRLDVTPQSTMHLWKFKQEHSRDVSNGASLSYDETIEQGRKTLKKLRSTDSNSIVSIKDQNEEKERIAIEKEYQEQQRLDRLEEEQEEKQRMAERKKQLAQTSSSASEGSPAVLGALGAVAVGGVGLAVAPRDQDDAEVAISDQLQRNDTRSRPSDDETTTLEGQPHVVTPQRVNGDSKTSLFPPASTKEEIEKERIAAAELAMQDYLDQDDGGEAWLQTLGEMMKEEDDD